MSLDNLKKRTDPGPSAPADETPPTPDQYMPPAAYSASAFHWVYIYICFNVLVVGYTEERRFKQEYPYANS